MRLLVLDESRILAWLVERLAPPGTEVVGLVRFEEACRALAENPPDAAIVSMTRARLPWREFQKRCASLKPPVPVLFESSVFLSAEEAGLEAETCHTHFLPKPAPIADFEAAVAGLLDAAMEGRDRPGPAASGAKSV